MNIGINAYMIFWVAVVGLCLGSFYNVVICRFLSNESIVFPSSKCPKCQHKLYFWHNIPVLSYLLLGGKCYFCKNKISIQYPLVELLTASLFLLSYLKFGFTIRALFSMIISSCFVIMSTTDIKEKLVNCKIAVFMAIIGLMFNFYVSFQAGLDAIYGLIVACIILELFARIGYLFYKTRAMGEADTYVAGAIGACFGLSNLFTILLYSIFAAMLFVLPVFIKQQIKYRNIKSVILLSLFIFLVLIYKLLIQHFMVFVTLLVISILLIIEILNTAKLKNVQTYLPFVPAFALGTLIWFFIA